MDLVWTTAGVVLMLAGGVLIYFGWTTREPLPLSPEELWDIHHTDL